MNQIILVFCAVLAMTNGWAINDADWIRTERYNTMDYYNLEPKVNEQIKRSKDLDALRTDLIKYVNKTEEDLNQSVKQCVNEYRTTMPTINNINQSMNACVIQISGLSHMKFSDLLNIVLEKFHEGFYNNTEECRQKFIISETNSNLFISCIFEKVQENDDNLRIQMTKKLYPILEEKVDKIEKALTGAEPFREKAVKYTYITFERIRILMFFFLLFLVQK